MIPPAAPIVVTTGLTKRYRDTLALSDLSLTVHRGEVVGLLGPNGAGKTTALHIILGLLTPTAGTVSIFGASPFTARYRILPRINFSSAYVSLPRNLSILQNLMIYARLYGVPNPRARIAELLALFEVEHLAKRWTGQLSSGELTRVNLCKSLLNNPALLLLDEPTASLDPDMADKVRRVLRRLQQEQGLAFLYTSHNMREVETMCDRLIFIHRGRQIAAGTVREVLAQFDAPSLEHVFITIAREGEVRDAAVTRS